MTGEPSPYQRPLREMTGSVVFLAAAIILRATWGTMYLPIFLVPLFVWFAYIIASGGNARRAEPKSRDETDRNWATEMLARPLWLDALALIINWMSIGFVVILFGTWDTTPPGPTPQAATSVILWAIHIIVAVAFALVFWERRQAQRTLESSPH